MNRALLALVLAVPLAGCISFGAKPPKQLLNLTANQQLAAGKTLSAGPGEAVSVLTPTLPAALAAGRVPVMQGATAIAYVKEAQWVEPPNRLFQRLLAETIEARTGRSVLSPRQYSADPGVRVSGDLGLFGIDEASTSAVVRYDATIVKGDRVETRRFEARVPVGAIEATAAGDALNRAANQVAGEAAAWITGG